MKDVVGVIDTVRTPEGLLELDVEALQGQVDIMKEQCEALRRDWVRLNEYFNKTARAYQWCSDYEERLHQYNSTFEIMKLVGRADHERGTTNRDPYRLPALPTLHFTYDA